VAGDADLIRKFTTGMTTWTEKHLGHAGRIQMIKSVIYSFANYWCQIFPFLKKWK